MESLIKGGKFDEERALYGSKDLTVESVRFEGPQDGESALKECENITAIDCYFNLRYPLWHIRGIKVINSVMTENCRAPLWYSFNVKIYDTKMHGIKALRECKDILIRNCDIISPEFGWSVRNIRMENSKVESEYFMMRARDIVLDNINFIGKYSFQYIKDAVFEKCCFDTKDAFWHAKDVVVRNSVVKGEYLGWYSENLTFENCKIIGTQPLCYCKNLRLLNCEMYDADLCFERSEVNATITTPVISVKNPISGTITLPKPCTVIRDAKKYKGEVIFKEN